MVELDEQRYNDHLQSFQPLDEQKMNKIVLQIDEPALVTPLNGGWKRKKEKRE